MSAARPLLAIMLGSCLAGGIACAHAEAADTPAKSARVPDRTGGVRRSELRGPRAPTAPPLEEGGEASVEDGSGGGETSAGAPAAEADPLVSNGLGSPLCKGVFGAGEMSEAGRRNCETSGFVAAPAPTGNYGIDVHINTGVLGLNLDTITQDVIVTPLWMALVWAVHALIVMLEWSFTVDLLDSSAAGGIGSGLRRMQSTVTYPWLAGVLAVASVALLYDGLIRRRVAESIGQAILAFAMMVAGMWVILDPTGTVGALGTWANQAAVGTLGVTAGGTPSGGGLTLAESMAGMFATVVEAPWCYLEFGDVNWCRDRSRLDPRLRAAGQVIASHELASIGCSGGGQFGSADQCVAPGTAQAAALEHSAELLRGAQSNGAIFLALPANGPARNSINEQESLLRTLCESSESTNCRGPTAAEAEFRDGGATWSRVGGLFLIIGGALGLLLLFGFIAVRLLGAAIFSLLFLLLAPAAVLAPALGEGGRDLFRRWAVRLLGAIVAKLIYAFVLGVLLAVVAVLAGLQALGWWTQWLLMSAFWWGAYTHRHQALAFVGGAPSRDYGRRTRVVVKRARSGVLGRALAQRGADRVKQALFERNRVVLSGAKRAADASARAGDRPGGRAESAGVDDQADRTIAGERRDARLLLGKAHRAEAHVADQGGRLERLRAERARAAASGDGRRAALLASRIERVEGEITRERDALARAHLTVGQAQRAREGVGNGFTREQREARGRFLDTQAALAPGLPSGGGRPSPGHRDYAALAALAGIGREEYDRLDPRARREAHLRIDRELTLRARRVPGAGRAIPASPGGRSPAAPPRSSVPEPPVESTVMRDAREVAARRKRQLGIGRP